MTSKERLEIIPILGSHLKDNELGENIPHPVYLVPNRNNPQVNFVEHFLTAKKGDSARTEADTFERAAANTESQQVYLNALGTITAKASSQSEDKNQGVQRSSDLLSQKCNLDSSTLSAKIIESANVVTPQANRSFVNQDCSIAAESKSVLKDGRESTSTVSDCSTTTIFGSCAAFDDHFLQQERQEAKLREIILKERLLSEHQYHKPISPSNLSNKTSVCRTATSKKFMYTSSLQAVGELQKDYLSKALNVATSVAILQTKDSVTSTNSSINSKDKYVSVFKKIVYPVHKKHEGSIAVSSSSIKSLGLAVGSSSDTKAAINVSNTETVVITPTVLKNIFQKFSYGKSATMDVHGPVPFSIFCHRLPPTPAKNVLHTVTKTSITANACSSVTSVKQEQKCELSGPEPIRNLTPISNASITVKTSASTASLIPMQKCGSHESRPISNMLDASIASKICTSSAPLVLIQKCGSTSFSEMVAINHVGEFVPIHVHGKRPLTSAPKGMMLISVSESPVSAITLSNTPSTNTTPIYEHGGMTDGSKVIKASAHCCISQTNARSFSEHIITVAAPSIPAKANVAMSLGTVTVSVCRSPRLSTQLFFTAPTTASFSTHGLRTSLENSSIDFATASTVKPTLSSAAQLSHIPTLYSTNQVQPPNLSSTPVPVVSSAPVTSVLGSDARNMPQQQNHPASKSVIRSESGATVWKNSTAHSVIYENSIHSKMMSGVSLDGYVAVSLGTMQYIVPKSLLSPCITTWCSSQTASVCTRCWSSDIFSTQSATKSFYKIVYSQPLSRPSDSSNIFPSEPLKCAKRISTSSVVKSESSFWPSSTATSVSYSNVSSSKLSSTKRENNISMSYISPRIGNVFSLVVPKCASSTSSSSLQKCESNFSTSSTCNANTFSERKGASMSKSSCSSIPKCTANSIVSAVDVPRITGNLFTYVPVALAPPLTSHASVSKIAKQHVGTDRNTQTDEIPELLQSFASRQAVFKHVKECSVTRKQATENISELVYSTVRIRDCMVDEGLRKLMTQCNSCRVVINRLPLKRNSKRKSFSVNIAQKLSTCTSCSIKCRKAYIKRLFRHGDPLAPEFIWLKLYPEKCAEMDCISGVSVSKSKGTCSESTVPAVSFPSGTSEAPPAICCSDSCSSSLKAVQFAKSKDLVRPNLNAATPQIEDVSVSSRTEKTTALCVINSNNQNMLGQWSVSDRSSIASSNHISFVPMSSSTVAKCMPAFSSLQTQALGTVVANSLCSLPTVQVKSEPNTYGYGDEGIENQSLVKVKEEPLNPHYCDGLFSNTCTREYQRKRKSSDSSGHDFDIKKQRDDSSETVGVHGKNEHESND